MLPVPDALGNPVGLPSGATSCTWITTGRSYVDTREGTIVPAGHGTITRVRLRVGPVTGPMQVVVLQSLRGVAPSPGGTNGGLACCQEVGRTRIFTPPANRVFTLATRLHVDNYINTRNDLAVFDSLALSVQTPGVPIPMNETGNYSALGGPLDVSFFPAMGPRAERANPAGVVGYVVLLNGTWVRTRR
jgi:hypothetical protein